MLEICIQTSYDQNVQLILQSYLPVVYGTPLRGAKWFFRYIGIEHFISLKCGILAFKIQDF
jgi:hypothetical protein